MSSGNIIYKIIRRTGYLDKIWDIVNSSYDKANSIEEKKEINIISCYSINKQNKYVANYLIKKILLIIL